MRFLSFNFSTTRTLNNFVHAKNVFFLFPQLEDEKKYMKYFNYKGHYNSFRSSGNTGCFGASFILVIRCRLIDGDRFKQSLSVSVGGVVKEKFIFQMFKRCWVDRVRFSDWISTQIPNRRLITHDAVLLSRHSIFTKKIKIRVVEKRGALTKNSFFSNITLTGKMFLSVPLIKRDSLKFW